MNKWIQLSLDFANQRNYLDELFRVYPTIPDGIRDIDINVWRNVEKRFNEQNNLELVKELLKLDLFPIKDSYIAYLKRDKSAIERNPQTINRIAGRLYEMGINKIFENCSVPKETNRQIGPMFRNWVESGALGLMPEPMQKFISHSDNAILKASDEEMKLYAAKELNYNHDKGLDFLARFNGKYVIGEAKFLTDYGGHQAAQFNDAINTIIANGNATKIAILDGVLYIPSKQKMHRQIINEYKDYNIMSALVLRIFLYQL